MSPVVADVMTQVVVTVEPETTIPELVSLLANRHISGAPVVSRGGEAGRATPPPALVPPPRPRHIWGAPVVSGGGEVLGVVSPSDVPRARAARGEPPASFRGEFPGGAAEPAAHEGQTVLDIATRR